MTYDVVVLSQIEASELGVAFAFGSPLPSSQHRSTGFPKKFRTKSMASRGSCPRGLIAQFSRLAEEVAILGILAASGSVVSGAGDRLLDLRYGDEGRWPICPPLRVVGLLG